MLRALLLCERPQDARTVRMALEEQQLAVDHCFEAYTAERLLESQSYAVIFFDLDTQGAMELMRGEVKRRTPSEGAVRIALANRSVPLGTLRLGVKAVLFRPVKAEQVGQAVAGVRAKFAIETQRQGEPEWAADFADGRG